MPPDLLSATFAALADPTRRAILARLGVLDDATPMVPATFVRRDGDVYRVGIDGKGLRRLTEGNRHVEFRLSEKDAHGSTDGPQVSPDGQQVAYVAVRGAWRTSAS